LFEAVNTARPDLLHEPVDDLNAGQVALVDGAVEALARERLLVDRAVGITVEEAAELVLQLVDALDRDIDQCPGQLLIVQPLAALDGVHEVALDRVRRREGDIVAALHHAGSAALPEQPLERDSYRQVLPGLLRTQRITQPGS